MYAARLDGFSAAERSAARLVALAGRAPLPVLHRALATAGLALTDLEALERSELCTLTDGVRWRHPLARFAASRGTAAQVRSANAVLAEAWAADAGPGRAWHLAEAAAGPDATASAALVEAAGVRPRELRASRATCRPATV